MDFSVDDGQVDDGHDRHDRHVVEFLGEYLGYINCCGAVNDDNIVDYFRYFLYNIVDEDYRSEDIDTLAGEVFFQLRHSPYLGATVRGLLNAMYEVYDLKYFGCHLADYLFTLSAESKEQALKYVLEDKTLRRYANCVLDDGRYWLEKHKLDLRHFPGWSEALSRALNDETPSS